MSYRVNSSTVALFGGALFSAGIAHAQQLDFASNGGGAFPSSYTFALAYNGLNPYQDVRFNSYDPSVLPAQASQSYQGWSAVASVTDTLMQVESIAGPEAFSSYADSWSISYAYVNQGVDTDVLISWDFSNELPGEDPIASFITIFDFTNQQVAFQIEPTSTPAPDFAGSEVFTLQAGVSYGITLTADVFEDNATVTAANGSAFAKLQVIPTPGAGLALGAAGFMGFVRRRR